MPEVTAVQKNRRAKGARHAQGVQTPAERRASEAAEGIRAGAILRQREAALDLLKTTAALEAEGIALDDSAFMLPAPTADDPAATVDAREILKGAEEGARKRGRSVGRWTPADGRYMSGADVTAAATVAAGAAARQMSAAGMPKLTPAEWSDLVSDLTLVALTRGAEGEVSQTRHGRPAEVLAYIDGGYRADIPAELAERRAIAATAPLKGAPRPEAPASHGAALDVLRWIATAERAATPDTPAWRALRAEGGDYRGAWRAYLTAHARSFARERLTAHRAQLAAEGAERDRSAKRAAELAEGRAIAGALADRWSLKPAEREAAAAALAGETHRERAAREGITPEAAKQRAKNGRRKLADRWPTAYALKLATRAAESEAAAAEWVDTPAPARAAYMIARHESEVSRLTGRPATPAAERERMPRAGRRLLLLAPRATGKVPARMPRHARTGARWLALMAQGLTVDPTDNRRPAPAPERNPARHAGGRVLDARQRESAERERAAARPAWTETPCHCADCAAA